MPFDHERLDVHQLALESFDLADDVVERHLADQLTRASVSIVKHHRRGRRQVLQGRQPTVLLAAVGSSTECAAMLDVCFPRASSSTKRRIAPRDTTMRRVIHGMPGDPRPARDGSRTDAPSTASRAPAIRRIGRLIRQMRPTMRIARREKRPIARIWRIAPRWIRQMEPFLRLIGPKRRIVGPRIRHMPRTTSMVDLVLRTPYALTESPEGLAKRVGSSGRTGQRWAGQSRPTRAISRSSPATYLDSVIEFGR
jgi:hypothetical protein